MNDPCRVLTVALSRSRAVTAVCVRAVATHGQRSGAGPPEHGLSSKKMALITSDCGKFFYPIIKWP